jgi:catechol 2,3-dioxygenase-like lactoylglutathione lyase family enzyme
VSDGELWAPADACGRPRSSPGDRSKYWNGWAGLGKSGKAELWFGTHTQAQQPLHVAFLAENREQVRAFYEAAIAAGAKDNGPPGIREIYHPDYYAAYVIGPDAHNIEAVCHAPER